MLNTIRKLASTAVLSAALLVGMSASGHAMTTLVGIGSGVGGPTPFSSNPNLQMSFVVIQHNGMTYGFTHGSIPGTDGWANSNVTSYMFAGQTLCIAGTVTSVNNAPFAVGDTVFFAINDNGNGCGSAPDSFLNGSIPGAFGSFDIHQIITDMNGDGVVDENDLPPEATFRHLVSGNFYVP